MKKIVITKLNGHDFAFIFNDKNDVELIKCFTDSLIDNVYVGKITEINKGLNCAFVSIKKDQKVFVNLKDVTSFKHKCGDNVLVQIKTDPLKTKLATGTFDITLCGQFSVLHAQKAEISVSRKLSSDVKDELIRCIENAKIEGLDDYGLVVRTNSALLLESDINPLIDEVNELIQKMDHIVNEGEFRTLYSVLYSAPSEALNVLKDLPIDEEYSLVTDNQDVYNSIIDNKIKGFNNIKLYEDEYISLKNLYNLETYLNRALDKKVYLDCGGYLIIEPTEAMTVIDVNSGKADGKKKDSSEYLFKVNKQAAIELCRQLIIRNISGVIMVDFINMSKKTDTEKLISILKDELSKDKIQASFVDMTQLGIAEITRKKTDMSLQAAFK